MKGQPYTDRQAKTSPKHPKGSSGDVPVATYPRTPSRLGIRAGVRRSWTQNRSLACLRILVGRPAVENGPFPSLVPILVTFSVMPVLARLVRPWGPSRVVSVARRRRRDDVSTPTMLQVGAVALSAGISCPAGSILARDLAMKVSVELARLKSTPDATVGRSRRKYNAKIWRKRRRASTGRDASTAVSRAIGFSTAGSTVARNRATLKTQQHPIVPGRWMWSHVVLAARLL